MGNVYIIIFEKNFLEKNKYFINKTPKYLKDFKYIFSSNSVGILLKYKKYNNVINLWYNKKLSFKLLYNLSEKEFKVLLEYLNNILN